MASLMSTLATLAPSGVKLSITATGRQMLSATLVELPLHQCQQHPGLWGQQRVQEQRHQGQEVLPVDPILQPAALVHCVEDPHQSL